MIDIDGDSTNEFDFNGWAEGTATSVWLDTLEAGSGVASSGGGTPDLLSAGATIDGGLTYGSGTQIDATKLAFFSESKGDPGEWTPPRNKVTPGSHSTSAATPTTVGSTSPSPP